MKIQSSFNYVPRRGGLVEDAVIIDVVDTSVDNVKNNISTPNGMPAKSYFTNSDVPVSLFGPGITATHYDPNRHRGAFAAKESAAATAAAAPSSSVAANSAANAAVGSVSSSNSATVNN